MKYRVVIEPDEDGVFVGECPALPGWISQAKTRGDALDNIKDAMIGYLASLIKHGESVPPFISEEIVEIPTRAACPFAPVRTLSAPFGSSTYGKIVGNSLGRNS